MMSTGYRGEAPKIVHIETRYVQTDAINFRDVVQSLTGKNSSTAWIGRNAGSSSVVAGSEIKGARATAVVTAKPEEGATSNATKDSLIIPSMLMSNVSFQDFDRLLFELPSMEMEGMPWF